MHNKPALPCREDMPPKAHVDFTAPVANRTRPFVRNGKRRAVAASSSSSSFAASSSTSAASGSTSVPCLLEESMDALCLVLEFLSYEQIVRSSRVCSLWRRCAHDKLDEWALVEPIKGHAVRGLKGRSFGKMRGPSSVSATSDGGLLVVDFLNRRIQVLHELQSDSNGSIKVHEVAATIDDSPCHIPTGICADPNAPALYVADNQSHAILRLALPGHPSAQHAGALLGRVGRYGRETDELWDPEAICVDDEGVL